MVNGLQRFFLSVLVSFLSPHEFVVLLNKPLAKIYGRSNRCGVYYGVECF